MSCSGWRLESLSKLERRICKQLLRTASQWLQMTRTYFLRHPGHNSACLLRQLAAGIHIITPHKVLRVAVAALMEVQEITTTQHVLFLSVIMALDHRHHAPRRAVVSENVMTVTAAIGASKLIVVMNCQFFFFSKSETHKSPMRM